MQPLPFEQLIDARTKRMQSRRVDVDGEAYACARRYMIRLERDDFEDSERLTVIAAAARLSTDRFRSRFGYLVDA
jgi:6-phosphofructokinase 1